MSEETKKCPYCAETIKAEAIICRFCGNAIGDPEAPTPAPPSIAPIAATPPKQTSAAGMLVLAILGVCILSFVLMFAIPAIQEKISPKPPTATSRPETSAWYACAQFVQRQLGISTSDAQRYNPYGVTALGGGEYEVVVHYAKYASTYRCVVLHRSNGDWQLTSLDAK